MATLEAVTDSTFDEVVLGSEIPVFVDFWAEWCPPCHRIAPVLDELAIEYAGRIRFVKVDVDDNPMVARRYGIMSMPTLSVFRAGAVVSQKVGAVPKSRLREQLDAGLADADAVPSQA